MAVKMRLRREGKRKQPHYRVVVADARSPRDGGYIEDIGYYQPLQDPSRIEIDRERALYWLHNGVQPSDAVVNLLRIEGIWEEFRPGDPGKDRSAKRAKEAAAKAAVEAERKAAEAKEREEQKAAAEAAAAEAAAAEAAVAEEPVVEEAVAEEPVVEEATAEEPVVEEATAEEDAEK